MKDRIGEVVVKNPATGKLERINPSTFYRMGVSSFLFKGGDGYRDYFFNGTRDGKIVNVNEMGAPEDVSLSTYIQKLVNITKQPDYDTLCAQQANIAIVRDGVTLPEDSICPAIQTTSLRDLTKICPTNRDFCTTSKDSAFRKISAFIGKVAWTTFYSVEGDPCNTCSGLGSCKDQTCFCNVPVDDNSPLKWSAVRQYIYQFLYSWLILKCMTSKGGENR
jgi:hypothetical protein